MSEVKPFSGGTLLFTGGTDWAMIGRAGSKKKDDEEREKLYPNLPEPHKLKAFSGIRIAFIAAGAAAVHCIAGDMDGRLYTWGRNEKGQLGHGDLVQRNNPKVVEGLEGKFAIGAAGGRHHTLVLLQDGDCYAFGCNTQGQLGVGSIKKNAGKNNSEDYQLKPVKSLVAKASAVSAGVDFSMWICDGKLMSAGNPQYGQTGDGSDHAYNAKEASIQIAYDPQPTPKAVPALRESTITRVACGQQHTVAVDDAGNAYTWGNGGYGRLGHRVQQDEFAPRKVEEFRGRISVGADAVVAAGSTSTLCTALVGGQQSVLYAWGKLKTSGDNQMYPIPYNDLCGWNVRSMSCGPATFAVAAEKSTITWGQATNGELGYGPKGKKSSANPAKVELLEGAHTHQVASGAGFTMFLVDPEATPLSKLPEFESSAPEEAAQGEEEEAGGSKAGGKRKAAAPAAKKGGKKAK